ncbi:MAG: tripartite tricarboxylate transporter substrate-binding protein [Burkholderiales bacterium]
MRKGVSGLLQVLVLGAMSLAAALNAQAQYPNRPIRLIIPSPSAGGPDIVGRLLALKLADAFGHQVAAENRVGGNGTIAGESVVKGTPDGYTMLVDMGSMLAINPHLYSKMPFDPQRDPSVPAHTLAEFIEHAKRTTPPLAYASGGNGSQHHLTMERLKMRAGFDMVHVPYKSASPATLATVAGGISTADEFSAAIRADFQRYGKRVRDLGAKVD